MTSQPTTVLKKKMNASILISAIVFYFVFLQLLCTSLCAGCKLPPALIHTSWYKWASLNHDNARHITQVALIQLAFHTIKIMFQTKRLHDTCTKLAQKSVIMHR